VNTFSNTFSMEYFRPSYHKRNVIAFKVTAAAITGYGGKEIPPNNRYYLGGEQDVRGYDFYTISPFVFIPYATASTVTFTNPQQLNQQGLPTAVTIPVNILEYVPTRPGGDTQGVMNLEYRIPIVGSYVGLTLFNDLGINGMFKKVQLDPSAIDSLQEQYGNTISKNLLIAPGTNFRPHTSAGIEINIQIPIIQAPLRIYYAYNYIHLNQTITPPLGSFYFSPTVQNTLEQLGVYNTQIVPQIENFLIHTQSSQIIPPNLYEPRTTLRFTVSRTF